MKTPVRQPLAWSSVGIFGLIAGTRALKRLAGRVQPAGDEPTQRLPGDELIAHPLASLTHAITIHAVPQAVWPWLAQMGAGRGGWYSYDGLDNGGEPSVASVVAEFQELTPGMIFPALPGATDGFTLASFDPNHFLVLGWNAPDRSWRVTWAFVLDEAAPGVTRLLVRARGGPGYRFHGLPLLLTRITVRVVHFIMQRKQLLGVKRRAESTPATRRHDRLPSADKDAA